MRLRLILCGMSLLGATSSALAAKPTDRDRDVSAERQDLEETDRLPAVQNRKYELHHEFAVGASHLPIDPYTKAMAVRGGYTWHLNTNWGIEGHFSWLFNYKSALRDKLEGNFAEPESKFRHMKFFGQLGALFKPIYGKLAFLNSDQAYGEFFLSSYAVFGQLSGGEKTEAEPAGRGERWAAGFAPGFGLRAFLTRHLSLRFDLNWLVLFTGGFLSKGDSPFEVVAPLTLSLNLAVTTR